MRVGIAADHEGYELKQQIAKALDKRGYEVKDFGAHVLRATDDYPDFVIPLAKGVSQFKVQRGIAICGSGIGACVMANKVRGVRAGIVHDMFSARRGVEDDDMNIVCLGARLVTVADSIQWVDYFLTSRFSNSSQNIRRVQKIVFFEEAQVRSKSTSAAAIAS